MVKHAEIEAEATGEAEVVIIGVEGEEGIKIIGTKNKTITKKMFKNKSR